jgi:hypothetical protein
MPQKLQQQRLGHGADESWTPSVRNARFPQQGIDAGSDEGIAKREQIMSRQIRATA